MTCLIEFHENYIIIKNEYVDIINILCILKQISLNNITYKACIMQRMKNKKCISKILYPNIVSYIFPHI